VVRPVSEGDFGIGDIVAEPPPAKAQPVLAIAGLDIGELLDLVGPRAIERILLEEV
jgi:hypothetical protein